MKKLAMLLALCLAAMSLPMALAEDVATGDAQARVSEASGETGAPGLIAVPDDDAWIGYDPDGAWSEEDVISQPEEWAVSALPEEETSVGPGESQPEAVEAQQPGETAQPEATAEPAATEAPEDPAAPHTDPNGPQLAANEVTLGVGEAFALNPVMPEGVTGAISCASDDAAVASVTAAGRIKAVAVGDAIVTVACENGSYAQCFVHVKKAPDAITLSAEALDLGLGEQYDALTATVGSAEGEFAGGYTLKSNRPKIVSVGEDGALQALAKGSATITAKTYNGLKATCKVTVKDAPRKLTVSVDKKTIGVGETAQIGCVLTDGSAGRVSYHSNSSAVLTVDPETGAVTGVAPGVTRVRVRTYNNLTKSVKIRVLPAPETLSFEQEAVTLGVGMKLNLAASVNEGAAGNITYTVKHITRAAYEKGVLKGVKKGATLLTARTYNGLTAKCRVRVVAAPKSVKLPYDKLTIGVKQTVQLEPDVGSSVSTYTYATSNSKVATVSADGVITGLKKGSCTITVKTYNGRKFKLKLTVKKAPGSISLKPAKVDLAVDGTEDMIWALPKNTAATVTFTLGDTSVASFDAETGKLTGLAPGETTLTATTHNGKKATTKVKVWPRPEWIEPDTSLLELLEGETHPLVIELSPGSRSPLTFTTGNKKVATVSDEGVITAVGGGETTIHVATNNPEVGCDIRVTVWPGPTKVSFDKTELELDVDDTTALKPVLVPEDSKTRFTYESSDEAIAVVSEEGIVTGLARGSVTITARAHNGKSAELALTVVDPWYPESVKLNNVPEYLKTNTTYQLTMTVKPKTALPDLEWRTSDESVAWVDENDVIHTSGFGYAVIRAMSRKNPDIKLEFTLAVETDYVTLTMPARITDIAGIPKNLAMIEAIHTSAINQLKLMYDGGVISASDASKRKSIVDNAFKDYAFPWMTPEYQDYWKAANSEGGVKDFKPGRVYYGIPYISTGRNREYNKAKALSENRYTDSGEGYYLLNRKNLLSGKYCGNDCSCFVDAAIWGTNSGHSNDRTAEIAVSSAYRTISGFGSMRTGDLICKGHAHVVMFLYYANADKSKVMIIENGGIEPGTNTVHCMIMDVKWYKDRGYKVRRLSSLG